MTEEGLGQSVTNEAQLQGKKGGAAVSKKELGLEGKGG